MSTKQRKTTMRKTITLLCLLALFAVAQNANAALFQFATRASWEAQTTGLVTHDFNDRANTYYTTLALGDVTFTAPLGDGRYNLLWISPPNSTHSNLGIALVVNVPGGVTHATFNPGPTAVGVDVRNLSWGSLPPNYTIVATVSTDYRSDAVYHIDAANFTFFGIATDTGHITRVVFSILGPGGYNQAPALDNFSYGDYEPAVIVDQSAGLTGGYIQSQDFPDIPTYSVSVFDDFTIGTAYEITELTALGRDYYGSPASNLSVVAGIYASPDLTIPPIVSASGIEVSGNLLFNFGGAMLPAGTYWVSARVVRPNSAGGWYWNLRAPVSGSQAMWHNPGGGFGRGTSPLRLGDVLVQADLAFLLYGIPRGTTATPTFSPAAGTYTTSQLVTIRSATAGATIHYTTNGAEPTERDPVVASGGTVLVDLSRTLRAKAWSLGAIPSTVANATYTLKVATPTFSPAGGTYSTFQVVTVRRATAGAVIHYTTNGQEPVESDPVIASGGTLVVDRTLTLKAKAWLRGWTPSATKSAVYTINGGPVGTVATPTFSLAPGTYSTPWIVTVSSATPGATIRYTTNGLTPTESDRVIASGGLVLVDRTLTLKAKAWKPAWNPSNVSSAVYTMKVATPTFSSSGGNPENPVNVTITCATPGVTIRYTTNGSTPTASHPVISSGSSLLIDHSLTLKARAWRSGWTASGIRSATFTIGSDDGGDGGPNE
jgi:hypothetical protein